MGRPRDVDLDTATERAMQLFWSQGYERSSTRDLVEATGLGQGSLYHAFGSKHGVFAAALDRYLAQQTEGVVAALAGDGPVRPAIRGVLETLVATDLADATRRGCLMVNCAAELGGEDALVTAKVAEAYGRIERALAAAIRRGRRSGELTSTGAGPDALARFLMTTINGLRVVAKTTDDPRRLTDTVAVALSAIG